MPKYDVSLYVEQRFDDQIEADSPEKALQIAKNRTAAEWGEPAATNSWDILVRNANGDVLAET